MRRRLEHLCQSQLPVAFASPTPASEGVSVTLKWPLIAAILSTIIAIGGPFALSSVVTDAQQSIVLPE